MYREFLESVLTFIIYLDELEKETEKLPHQSLRPYLGQIPMMMEGEIVGYLRNDDGVGWGYFPNTEPTSAPIAGATRHFGVGWTPLSDMFPSSTPTDAEDGRDYM